MNNTKLVYKTWVFLILFIGDIMDKITENTSTNHNVGINERKSITISGIKKIESFDTEEFLLSSTLGPILLKGENLEIIKLNTLDGNVAIKGKINSLQYLDSTNSSKENGLFSKLFKWQ